MIHLPDQDKENWLYHSSLQLLIQVYATNARVITPLDVKGQTIGKFDGTIFFAMPIKKFQLIQQRNIRF